ncbi:MAG TPA: hypothetical protein V6C88_07365, partial [Chroococcidiopsis sp.]
MSNRPAGLFIGATYPFRAIALLFRTPKLWPYIIAPIIINVVVGLTVYAGLLFLGLRAIDALLANVPVWLAEVPAEVSHFKEVAPAIALPVFSAPGWWTAWWTNWHLSLPALPDWHLSLPDWHLS